MAGQEQRKNRGNAIAVDKAAKDFLKWLEDKAAARACGPRTLQLSFDQGSLVKFDALEPMSVVK